MEKSERFGLVLSAAEKQALRTLAQKERISSAAIVRRLIWREAKRAHHLRSQLVQEGQHEQ